MLENYDRKFTDEDRQRLLNSPVFPQSPRNIADEAEMFVKSLPVPLMTEAIIPQYDVEIVQNEKTFYERLYEDYSASSSPDFANKRSREFLDFFNKWKQTAFENFSLDGTVTSYIAADIVDSLSLSGAYTFAREKMQLFKSKSRSNDYTHHERQDYLAKKEMWETMKNVAHYAHVLNASQNPSKT